MSNGVILIVGGAGYIGSHVNRLLSESGYQTVVLDNFSTGYRDFIKWGKCIEGDLNNIQLLEKIFQDNHIKAVMHFGAKIEVGESVKNPLLYYQNNFSNTINLLAAMRSAKVNHFIFSSTAAVYGIPEKSPVSEESEMQPINPYGMSKYMVERALEDLSRMSDFRYVSLRYFNAAGAHPDGTIGEKHQPESHLIPRVLDVATGRQKQIEIFGNDYETPDGTCVRDYIHVCDLAQAHLLAMRYLEENKTPQIFNLGNGAGFSVKQVIETTEKVTGNKIESTISPRRDGDPAILVAGSDKIRSMLGWKPEYEALEKIIATAWNWHKKIQRNIKVK